MEEGKKLDASLRGMGVDDFFYFINLLRFVKGIKAADSRESKEFGRGGGNLTFRLG